MDFGVWPIPVFLGLLNFFNLTRPLNAIVNAYAECNGISYMTATHGCCDGAIYLKVFKGCCECDVAVWSNWGEWAEASSSCYQIYDKISHECCNQRIVPKSSNICWTANTHSRSLYRMKPEELYILSYEKGRGRRPWPFSQLRMYSSEGFNWLKTPLTIMRNPHNQQLGRTWLIRPTMIIGLYLININSPFLA